MTQDSRWNIDIDITVVGVGAMDPDVGLGPALVVDIGEILQIAVVGDFPGAHRIDPVLEHVRVVETFLIEEAQKVALDVLREVDLEDKLHAYPAQLSGGQQQRVAIARALAMRPRLMLFDEITSALDPELVGEVVKVLERLAMSGMTMALVTHEMGFARRTADTLVFMHQGRVWEKGPPRELFATPKTAELESFIQAVLEPND